MTLFNRLLAALMLIVSLGGVAAAETDLEPLIDKLATGKLKDRGGQIEAIAATGDPRVVPALEALRQGRLYYRRSDDKVFIAEKAGDDFRLMHPISGETVETLGRKAVRKVKVNNRLRRQIGEAVGALTLGSDDPQTRIAAADTMFKSADPAGLAMLDDALAGEQVAAVRSAMERARAAMIVNSNAPDDDKLAAVALLSSDGGRAAMPLLQALAAGSDGAVREAADAAIAHIERSIALWNVGETVWHGISLGSVLLLAAIGLAVTFGVMGVINMAHGEMVMLGAYTTFVVQELIRTHHPGLFEYSLVMALPLAFLVSGACGLAHRARRNPLSLRPAAGDVACHLGRLAHPAAGGAHHFRPDQPGGRQPVLDVGRLSNHRAD